MRKRRRTSDNSLIHPIPNIYNGYELRGEHKVMCPTGLFRVLQRTACRMAISYFTGMKKHPDFGPVLRRLRFERNLSQEVLAERAGMASHAHLSRLESGHKQPSVEMLFRLADALEVSASAIISEMEKERHRAYREVT